MEEKFFPLAVARVVTKSLCHPRVKVTIETSKKPASASLRFGKQYRITRPADFNRLQRKGRKLYARHFLLIVDPSPTNDSRLAIAVTKKVEPRATTRNRLRRRLKEIFRTVRSDFRSPFDILIIARNNAISCEFEEIRQELLGALRQGGIINSR